MYSVDIKNTEATQENEMIQDIRNQTWREAHDADTGGFNGQYTISAGQHHKAPGVFGCPFCLKNTGNEQHIYKPTRQGVCDICGRRRNVSTHIVRSDGKR